MTALRSLTSRLRRIERQAVKRILGQPRLVLASAHVPGGMLDNDRQFTVIIEMLAEVKTKVRRCTIEPGGVAKGLQRRTCVVRFSGNHHDPRHCTRGIDNTDIEPGIAARGIACLNTLKRRLDMVPVQLIAHPRPVKRPLEKVDAALFGFIGRNRPAIDLQERPERPLANLLGHRRSTAHMRGTHRTRMPDHRGMVISLMVTGKHPPSLARRDNGVKWPAACCCTRCCRNCNGKLCTRPQSHRSACPGQFQNVTS